MYFAGMTPPFISIPVNLLHHHALMSVAKCIYVFCVWVHGGDNAWLFMHAQFSTLDSNCCSLSFIYNPEDTVNWPWLCMFSTWIVMINHTLQ